MIGNALPPFLFRMTLLVKPITGLLGLALLIVGIAGFFTGGIVWMFEVEVAHRIVLIISGLIALVSMRNYTYARLYLILFGLLFGIAGVIASLNEGNVFGIFSVDVTTNLLHFGFAGIALLVGFGSKARAS